MTMRRSGPTNPAVRFEGQTVLKTSEPGQDPVETVEKLNPVAECGKRTATFVAPLAWVVDSETIAMDRLSLGMPLQAVYARFARAKPGIVDEGALAIFTAAGRALSSLHQHLRPAAQDLPASGQLVWLHCDYGFSNLYCGEGGELVVLDPMPLPGTNESAWKAGERSSDLGMFVSCVIGRGGPSLLIRSKPARSAQLLRCFLDAYGIDNRELEKVFENARTTTDEYFSNAKLSKRLLGPPIWRMRLFWVQKELEKL